MSKPRNPKAWAAVAIATMALALASIGGASGHITDDAGHDWNKHFLPLAKKSFYTKGQLNQRSPWAVVDATGMLVRGRGVTSTNRIGEGLFHFIFDRSLNRCTFAASAGASNGGFSNVYTSVNSNATAPGHAINVAVYGGVDNQLADPMLLHLSVVC
jgi:hypothetical protein